MKQINLLDLRSIFQASVRGRASPCQGEGRGFESHHSLKLLKIARWWNCRHVGLKINGHYVRTGSSPVGYRTETFKIVSRFLYFKYFQLFFLQSHYFFDVVVRYFCHF